MACPVLAWFRFHIAALALLAPPIVVFGQTARPATTHCTADPSATLPKSQRETLKELQQSVESGPLYQELVSTTGKPQSCEVAWKDGDLTLSYLFNKEGRLRATITPAIEVEEERVKLPKLQPVTEEQALALLKAGAKHHFHPRQSRAGRTVVESSGANPKREHRPAHAWLHTGGKLAIAKHERFTREIGLRS